MNIRTSLLTILLATLFSAQASAYQYAYGSPQPYNAHRGYYYPYLRAPHPYYSGYGHVVQHGYSRAPAPAQPPVSGKTRTREAGAKVDAHSAAEAKQPSEKTQAGLSAGRQAFINTLLPHIEQENRRLTGLRNELARLFSRLESDAEISSSEHLQISALARKYRVKGDPLQDPAAREELVGKIDIIPASLALAQAVNESAWGESRFAQQANNLFGIWTYDEDKGLKPLNREEGKTHLVRIFDDIGESVSYYMYNLNSHPAYSELRQIRGQLRASGRAIDGHKLAAGLEKYSAKGQAYIDLIRSLIRQNDWALLDSPHPRA
jgi:Bax protein